LSRSLVLLGRYARHGLYALLAARLMPNLRFLEGPRPAARMAHEWL